LITAEEVINALNLQKHPTEGGHFSETFRSQEIIGDPGRGQRCYSTAIYYLLTDEPGVFSEMHKLTVDEVFHFYLGDPVEMLHLYPDGSGKRLILGNNLAESMQPQVTVSKDVWQGCRVVPGSGNYGYALMGTTVAPGFEYSDYLSGSRAELIKRYSQFKELISVLTRKP
jgi:predicted cupin superfamily sugar epimerase